MGETKPLKLSTILSIAYSDFRVDFRELRTSEGFLYIADFGRRPAKPNKANVVKAFVINNMTEKSARQTQRAYHSCYQLLAAILPPSFRKFGWERGASLSRIRAHGRARRIGDSRYSSKGSASCSASPRALISSSANPESLTSKPGRKSYHSLQAPRADRVSSMGRGIGQRNNLLDSHPLIPV